MSRPWLEPVVVLPVRACDRRVTVARNPRSRTAIATCLLFVASACSGGRDAPAPTPVVAAAPPTILTPPPTVTPVTAVAPVSIVPPAEPRAAPSPTHATLAHPFAGLARLDWYPHEGSRNDGELGRVPLFDIANARVQGALDRLATRDLQRMSTRGVNGTCDVAMATEHVLAWGCDEFVRVVIVDGEHVVARPEVAFRDAASRAEVLGPLCPACATPDACPTPIPTSTGAVRLDLDDALPVHVDGCGDIALPWAWLAGRLDPASPLAHVLGAAFVDATPQSVGVTPTSYVAPPHPTATARLVYGSGSLPLTLETWRTLPAEHRADVRFAVPAAWGVGFHYGLVLPEPADATLAETLAHLCGRTDAPSVSVDAEALGTLDEREVLATPASLPEHAETLSSQLPGTRVVALRGRVGWQREPSGFASTRAWTYAASGESRGGWIETARLGSVGACATPGADVFEPHDLWGRTAVRTMLRSAPDRDPDRVLFVSPGVAMALGPLRWRLSALDACAVGRTLAESLDETSFGRSVRVVTTDRDGTTPLVMDDATFGEVRRVRLYTLDDGRSVLDAEAQYPQEPRAPYLAADGTWSPLAFAGGAAPARTWHWDRATLVADPAP